MVVLSVALGVSLVLVGCAKPTPAPEAEVITWIAQDENPLTASSYVSLDMLCKKVEEATGGRLIIKPNPGGAIVPADTEIDGVNKGILDLGHGAFISMSGDFPAAPLFDTIVAGPTALEYYFWYLWGPGIDLSQEMLDSKEYNVKVVAVDANLPEVFLYTNKPIKTVADLKGMTLRLLGDEAAIFGKFGVSATATSSGELYEAMDRGVIDGFQHSNLAADWDLGFQECVNYAYTSTVRQPTDVFVYYVNKDTWEALPDDLKTIVEEATWVNGIRHYADWTYRCTQVLDKWTDAGVVVEPISGEIEDALIGAANDYYAERAAADPFFAKVYNSLLEWQAKYDLAFPRL